MQPVQILLILAIIVYVMGRRLVGEPLQAKRLLILPLVGVVLGGYQLTKVHVTSLDVAVLAGEALVALCLGAVRGLTIRVYERGGHLWYRYSPLTIVMWLASAAVRVGLGFAAHAAGATLTPLSSLTMMLGVTLLGEAAVVGTRALRTGVAFAPDRRTVRAAGYGRTWR